jgi:NADPH-dependent curcumin reductase CurA
LHPGPVGAVVPENFRIVETEAPKPGAGEVLVRNEWLSLDPYMRGRMSDAKSYAKHVELGEVMTGQTVARSSNRRTPPSSPATRC